MSQKLPIPVPHKGLLSNFAPWEQPPDSLFGGSNVLVRDGRIIVRPGLRKLDATGFGERVMGGIFYLTSSGSKRTVAGGITKRKQYTGGAWADITGTTWTGGATNQVRFVEFPKAGVTYIIGVNGKDATIVWDGAAATDSDLGGGAPIAKDVTACANRIIYGNVTLASVNYPASFMYSESNDHTTTKAASLVSVGEGTGHIIAVRNLGVQSFSIYTRRGQYVATSQGGAIPFRVDYRSGEVGPVSPAAVVTAGFSQYYLGDDANFYRFDGTPATPIGDGIHAAVRASLNPDYRDRSHGVYDRNHREIHWFWVPLGDTDVKAGITYSLKTGIWSPIHSFGRYLSASWDWDEQSALTWLSLSGTWTSLGITYATWLAMGAASAPAQIVGQGGGQTYIYGGRSTDDGDAISTEWEYPALAVGGDGNEFFIETVEPYYKQLGSAMILSLRLGTQKFPGGTISWETAQTFDMSAATFGSADKTSPQAQFENVYGRAASIKCSTAAADVGMEFYGGVARVQPRQSRRT